jgi:hypothetical protein
MQQSKDIQYASIVENLKTCKFSNYLKHNFIPIWN